MSMGIATIARVEGEKGGSGERNGDEDERASAGMTQRWGRRGETLWIARRETHRTGVHGGSWAAGLDGPGRAEGGVSGGRDGEELRKRLGVWEEEGGRWIGFSAGVGKLGILWREGKK